MLRRSVEQRKFSITPNLWQEVKQRAAREGVSASHWVRQAVIERLERERHR